MIVPEMILQFCSPFVIIIIIIIIIIDFVWMSVFMALIRIVCDVSKIYCFVLFL